MKKKYVYKYWEYSVNTTEVAVTSNKELSEDEVYDVGSNSADVNTPLLVEQILREGVTVKLDREVIYGGDIQSGVNMGEE